MSSSPSQTRLPNTGTSSSKAELFGSSLLLSGLVLAAYKKRKKDETEESSK